MRILNDFFSSSAFIASEIARRQFSISSLTGCEDKSLENREENCSLSELSMETLSIHTEKQFFISSQYAVKNIYSSGEIQTKRAIANIHLVMIDYLLKIEVGKTDL